MYTHILNMYSKKSTRDSTKMLRIIPVKYHMLIIIVTNLWFRKMDEELGCIDNVHIHNEIKSHIRIYSIYWQHTLYRLWLNNGLNGSNIDKKTKQKKEDEKMLSTYIFTDLLVICIDNQHYIYRKHKYRNYFHILYEPSYKDFLLADVLSRKCMPNSTLPTPLPTGVFVL